MAVLMLLSLEVLVTLTLLVRSATNTVSLSTVHSGGRRSLNSPDLIYLELTPVL